LPPYLHVLGRAKLPRIYREIGCASLSLQRGLANGCVLSKEMIRGKWSELLIQKSVEVFQCLLDSNLKIK